MADQDRDLGLGFCGWLDCSKYAVVALNGVAMCLVHFDKGLRETIVRLKRGLRFLTDDR